MKLATYNMVDQPTPIIRVAACLLVMCLSKKRCK